MREGRERRDERERERGEMREGRERRDEADERCMRGERVASV